MARYIAYYTCTKCGAQRDHVVDHKPGTPMLGIFPRWLYPDVHKMRRAGGIQKLTDKDKIK